MNRHVPHPQPPHFPGLPCSRRSALRACTLALAGLTLPRHSAQAADPEKQRLFPAIGIAAGLDKAENLKQAGAEFLTLGVGNFLVPDQPDEVFAKNLEKLAAAPLPLLTCNGFIRPANLRCVGADANHDAVLAWSDTAFQRLKRAGGKFIVFGSSGARALRDGWPRDKADAQFTSLLQRMGALAEKHDVGVVVEALQSSECNYINRISQTAALIRAAAHPRIRVLADLFHMAREGDTPEDLKKAADVVAHIEIAEVRERTVPGVHGDDFRPWFRILRDAGYRGAICIEGRGSDAQMPAAFAAIRRQAAEVMAETAVSG